MIKSLKIFFQFIVWRLTLSVGWYWCEYTDGSIQGKKALYWDGYFWNHRLGRSNVIPHTISDIYKRDPSESMYTC